MTLIFSIVYCQVFFKHNISEIRCTSSTAIMESFLLSCASSKAQILKDKNRKPANKNSERNHKKMKCK
jgi:hypothetical protein